MFIQGEKFLGVMEKRLEFFKRHEDKFVIPYCVFVWPIGIKMANRSVEIDIWLIVKLYCL